MTDLDQLATDIQHALENRYATSDQRRVTCAHETIVRVLREFVAEHELEKMTLLDTWVKDKEKLEHQIAQLEVRVEELNKH